MIYTNSIFINKHTKMQPVVKRARFDCRMCLNTRRQVLFQNGKAIEFDCPHCLKTKRSKNLQ